MSLPYFNLYPTDFEAKTSHLTLEEDGAYNRLLRLCWMTPGCSLPDDNAWIMRRMRVDQDTFDRVVLVVLDEFFEREKGRVSNAKLTKVFVASSEAHKKRVNAGSAGGKAKALKTNNSGSSNAKAKPKQPEPEPELDIREDTNVSLLKSDLANDSKDFSEAYPQRNGKKKSASNSKKTRMPKDAVLTSRMIEIAVEEGHTPEEAAAQFKIFKNGAIANGRAYVDWSAAWRNWFNSQYFKAMTGGTNGQRSNADQRAADRDSALADEILAAARAR